MTSCCRLVVWLLFVVSIPVCWSQPLATGHAKFLGSIYSTSQVVNFTTYFNQVTPENAGKWGSVEATRDVMNWTELDAAYALAKNNGFPFRFHVLVWGSQQPNWIAALPATEQLTEIQEWFDAVAARYPNIDYLEVVNEPTNDPPDGAEDGGYINALGGSGTTGWDWVLTAFRMARARFPASTKLMLNEYNVTNGLKLQSYLQIINLLKAESLIDVVGMQAHSFSTTIDFTSSTTTLANLNTLAATGLPLMVTEMDIDGPTDARQLSEYQRIFPIFWEHPSVIGITLWGYRPGLWRNAEQAYIVLANGTERPAMVWLDSYLHVAGDSTTRLVNIATRAQSRPGNDVTIGGFVISGNAPKRVLVRGVGPSLTAHGIAQAEVLIDPMIELHFGNQGVIARNDNWGEAGDAAEILAVAKQIGAAALEAGDVQSSALLVTLNPGAYTFIAKGKNNASGIVLLEVYDADPTTSAPKFVNIATRARATTGNGVTIGGFVISGSGSKRVLLRAVGPTLATMGIAQPDVLADPMIELHGAVNGVPTKLAENDDWGTNANVALISLTGSRIGAAPLDTSDTKSSALLVTLKPGAYTFIASGKGATSGIVLVEVYDAD